MILLISPSDRSQECAAAFEAAAKEKVQVASTLKRGLGLLRAGEFSVVVLDESLLDLKPGEDELVVRRLGTAMPVYVNLGINGADRVVNQLRAALRRRQEESTMAFRAAEAHLRSELRGDLTALLLSSGMALHDPLPAETEAKLKSIQEVASRMKARLHAG